MIFRPKKRGGYFFDIIDPLPTPTSLKSSKKWVAGGGGVETKNSFGDAFIGQINDFTKMIPTTQPLGVGYANRPKKARNGGVCGISPYVRACLALIVLPSASPPRRESIPSNIQPKWGKNYINTGEITHYISWMFLLGDPLYNHEFVKKTHPPMSFLSGPPPEPPPYLKPTFWSF